MDNVQTLLVIVVISLTILLVVVGVQVMLIIIDLRRAIKRLNSILGRFNSRRRLNTSGKINRCNGNFTQR